MNTLTAARAASLFYPVMLTQEHGDISEAKAAELLGVSVLEYRTRKDIAIQAVMMLVTELQWPLSSLVEAIAARPELFAPSPSASNSNGMGHCGKST